MRQRKAIYDVTQIALFAALISVSSLIAIPLAVPITLQTLAIFLALYLIGPIKGMAAITVYLFIGAVGLPVFSGMTGGVSRFFDATGGFLFGFLPMALVYFLIVRALSDRIFVKVIASAVALLVLYATGTCYYAFVYLDGAESIWALIATTVLPFIIPDAVKIFIAITVSEKIPKNLLK